MEMESILDRAPVPSAASSARGVLVLKLCTALFFVFLLFAVKSVGQRLVHARRVVERRNGLQWTFVILFDGECVMCNAFVQFCLARCGRLPFFVAPLNSTVGRWILRQHHLPLDLDSFAFVEACSGSDPRVYTRSDAALHCLSLLFPRCLWLLMMGFDPVPLLIRDAVYNIGWRYRRRIFGTLQKPREWPGKALTMKRIREHYR